MALRNPPQFNDGNVEIHFSDTDDKYVLHSYVLALHSPWFKASLSERWNGGGKATTQDGKNHWVFELRFGQGDALGMLARKTDSSAVTNTELSLGSKGKPVPHTWTKDQVRLHSERVCVIEAHQDLLCALYHMPPTFSSEPFSTTRHSILRFAHTAEIYGCEKIAQLHIDNHLHRFQKDVLDLCYSAQISTLEFAIDIKSTWIFTEAGKHLLGRNKRSFDRALPLLEAMGLKGTFEKMRGQFCQQLKAAELEVFLTQPPYDDYESLQAIGFFRHWFAEQITDERQGSALGPGYAAVYRTIAEGYSENFKVQNRDFIENYSSEIGIEEGFWRAETVLEDVFACASQSLQPILKDVTIGQRKMRTLDHSLRFMHVLPQHMPGYTAP